MGFLSGIVKGIGSVFSGISGFLPSIVSGIFGSIQQNRQNAFNANEAEKNRQFQSDEAELNRMFQSNEAALQRDWSSQEAERARDWQEEMNAKYNSISGKIAQAEEAGVNPMYAVTGNAVSPASASASAPSGAAAGSPGLPSGSAASAQFVDIIGAILNARKTQAEINLINAEAEEKRTNTSWIDRLSEAQLDNLVASTSKLEEDLRVSSETANKLSAEYKKLIADTSRINQIVDVEKRKLEAEAALLSWQNENKEWMYAANLSMDVISSINQIAQTVIAAKTGVSLGDRPLVVPAGAQVFHPRDIAH